VTNDEKGITSLLNRLEPYIVEGNKYLIKTAIESTGNLWINMYEALEQQKKKGVIISLANPLKTRAIGGLDPLKKRTPCNGDFFTPIIVNGIGGQTDARC
jgi:hypothetical protein